MPRRSPDEIYAAAEKKIERARERRADNLNLGERRRSLKQIPTLAGLSFLRRLSIPETGVSDLTFLFEVPLLSSLNLSNTPVWDISPLSKLKDLVSLDLHHTNVSDLSPLVELKKLRNLVLRESACVDLSPLAYLKRLTLLDLSSTHVEDISALGNLYDLLALDLSFTKVQSVRCISNLSHLRNLRLDSSQVNDLAPLADMKSLVVGVNSSHYYFQRRIGSGLAFSKCPLVDKELLRLSKLSSDSERTIETISYLRRQRGLPPLTDSDLSKKEIESEETDNFERLRPLENIPSPYAFEVSRLGNIALGVSTANIPVFPNATSEKHHANRLDVCRTLANDLVSDLENKRYQARPEYSEMLLRYESRLPTLPNEGNILLADAEARTLRNLFAAEASILSAGFSSKLKTFLEQHMGLRVFYPEIAHFYRDVQSGRLEFPLPLDAVEAFVEGVRASTPTVFDESVIASIEGGAEPAVTLFEAQPTEVRFEESVQLSPPKDPLGELDPQKSRDFTFAGAANGLWKAFLAGEKIHKAADGWKTTGETLYPHVTQIIDWLRQFLSSGNGTPPVPPTFGV